MNKFLHTLLLSSVIFAQAAVAMSGEEGEHEYLHTAFVRKTEDLEKIMKIMDAKLASIPRGVRALIGGYVDKGMVTLGRSAFMTAKDDFLGFTFSVGALKELLEIDEADGDLFPGTTPTDTRFSKVTFFSYRGKEFMLSVDLPCAFISKHNYKDDEVIDVRPESAMWADFESRQYRSFHLPPRDICLLPKDRYKSRVDNPGAGLRDSDGKLLDPATYYSDDSISTENCGIRVFEKPKKEQQEEQKEEQKGDQKKS